MSVAGQPTFVLALLIAVLWSVPAGATGLADGFASPPDSARPWTYWFWINGNISKEGITADLEAFRRVGVGGVLWMEVSGQQWAPDGPVTPLSPEWHDAMQWAVRECDRLGLKFDITLDFGYGSGGPHITPDRSMQKLLWTETVVEGGRPVDLTLPKPSHSEAEKKAVEMHVSTWLRPGAAFPETVRQAIDRSDAYRDVAVVAVPMPESPDARNYRIADLAWKSGLVSHTPNKRPVNRPVPPGAATPLDEVIDLTGRVGPDGRLRWQPPAGRWLVIRYGHDSNLKTTRPSPTAAVGLECNRLEKTGIETHYDAFLDKIVEAAGPAVGRTLAFAHIDSWEARCQNWTASFPDEFRARRGYDLRPWLPVLTGRVVGSPELSERFLWDVRATAGEMILDNYAARFRQLLHARGMRLSIEAYGNLAIDNLAYAGISDMPISEFWARGGDRLPPLPPTRGYPNSTKAMASAAHTCGKPIVGAEAFTSDRQRRDHPYLIKGLGDWAFCQGVNRMIFHLSAHQAYNHMIPGLTHRMWGEHFDRHNTWWDYSRPWMEYLARCQFLLRQGRFVADVCYWVGEGAPVNVEEITLQMPEGYDYDQCSSQVLLQAEVRDGRLVLPSGASYRYLRLPDTDRITLPMARKIHELADAGARILGDKRPQGTPGLTDYPQADAEVRSIAAALWDSGRVLRGKPLADVFAADRLAADFEGPGLRYHHRTTGEADIYFVSHPADESRDIECTFRVAGSSPELWDPETGRVRPLPDFRPADGRVTIPLHFEPMQSWFIVFPKGSCPARPTAAKNFVQPRTLRTISGPWRVSFDPRWGGPAEPLSLDALDDWSKHPDPRVHHYSGTAVYRKTIELAESDLPETGARLLLDLGDVEVMARLKVNGTDSGIAWKPPYRLDITEAARHGRNTLEIDVVNLWINRMIGDEQLPLDSQWKDPFTLLQWPAWFQAGEPSPTGRYTFTTARHYQKASPLAPSGLLGPVTLRSAPPAEGQP